MVKQRSGIALRTAASTDSSVPGGPSGDGNVSHENHAVSLTSAGSSIGDDSPESVAK